MEQRWLVDMAIRTNGIEWDQPRLRYTLAGLGTDQAAGEMEILRSRIRKVADFVPVVCERAQSHEDRARLAADSGHSITAGEHWYAAAMLWALSVWPIWSPTQRLAELDAKKNGAYSKWAETASHRVERVEIPFGDSTLPAWLHLPREAGQTPIPIVLACGGMDAPRETIVAREGDALLSRGMAVLAFDGPGQGESASRGIHVTSDNWIDAGRHLLAWCDERTEIDGSRVVLLGTSFGSFWITQIAATQPRVLGCASVLPVFEPEGRSIFEEASPTFKARHMFMAGMTGAEAAFDEMVKGYDLRPLVEQMSLPWLVVTGEADELSPIDWTYDLIARKPGPKELVVYQGARHALTESLAPVLGPSRRALVADWLSDRVADRPSESSHTFINQAGGIERRPVPVLAASMDPQ